MEDDMRQQLALATILALGSTAAYSADTIIGITGAITGPAASSYAPAVDGLRIYVERLNKAGGVNGKQVKLLIQDDQGEPSKAANNAKKLLQDGAQIVVSASLSSTYAPIIAEAKRAEVPVLFAGSVCPKEVFPPADKLLFCTTAFTAEYDSRAAIDFVKETKGTNLKLALGAMAIPVSRGGIDFAEGYAKSLGMTIVDKQIIPPTAADYMPFATKIKSAEPDLIYSWAPWINQVRTFEAMRKLGWQNTFVTWGHLEAEEEMVRLKDPNLLVLGANALFFNGDLPIHKEIIAAAKAAGSTSNPNQLTEGWIAGLTIETLLKQIGSDNSSERIRSAMQTLKIDTKGLRGGPIEFTPTNHFRTTQYYRIYKWDSASNQITIPKNWFKYEIDPAGAGSR
ncbi:MAG: ABC transporter substrate-binding protein [Betaproteobacteria bacterium]|jgi:branched-chain amino acid transport system substrate-binding protein|nr:ABC transporter substrate-binding protein [Betaproteobacteria bacterium]